VSILRPIVYSQGCIRPSSRQQELKIGVQVVETFTPYEDNTAHVNTIRAVARAILIHLRAFQLKLEKYELSLEPYPVISKKAVTCFRRKVRSQVFHDDHCDGRYKHQHAPQSHQLGAIGSIQQLTSEDQGPPQRC
jgi:hypothetical protein